MSVTIEVGMFYVKGMHNLSLLPRGSSFGDVGKPESFEVRGDPGRAVAIARARGVDFTAYGIPRNQTVKVSKRGTVTNESISDLFKAHDEYNSFQDDGREKVLQQPPGSGRPPSPSLGSGPVERRVGGDTFFHGQRYDGGFLDMNPWMFNKNTGFQRITPRRVNSWLDTLCMGVRHDDMDNCRKCFFNTDLPTRNGNYLQDFISCADSFKMSRNFEICKSVAAAINCMDKVLQLQSKNQGDMNSYDFFLLAQCFSMENILSMDKTLLPMMAHAGHEEPFQRIKDYPSPDEDNEMKKKLLLQMLMHLMPLPETAAEREMIQLL
ncbi:unnamed protein product [Darwinula stevensoni]|uniref:Uncharacterized protein n=1 Tax=Darwinula stevensoni TaxID=69355 RepID=A0A7R8X7X2_9CRUS|nr:unnamed protein product [Darwinula stevensoni]CAG0883809.1 unnamed protein product [Darwinula stevensoni]